MTTFRSARDAPVRVRAVTGVGVEDTTPRGTPGLRIWALPTSPGACELRRPPPPQPSTRRRRERTYKRSLGQGPGTYFGPSPGPKSSGLRFGWSLPDSLSESNISSAFNMAWSMLKYL